MTTNAIKPMMLFLCTLQHLAVDGVCGAVLAAYAVNEAYLEPIIYYFALYNLVAFGTQFVVGYLLDKRTNFLPYAPTISLTLLTLGSVSEFGIMNQVLLLGAGNSIFHVAAGSVVLRKFDTYKELGIFVSSGAIGLALGLNQLVDAKIFLLVYAAAIFYVGKNFARIVEHESTEIPRQTKSALPVTVALVCVILLLGCVVLRSFGGGGNSSEYVMLFPCAFAFGKILGGLCCDKIGYKNTIAVIFVAGFLALQWSGLIAALILTVAFNMTMPLTLRLVHWCNPTRPGMMFGLAAGCLLPGVFANNFNVAPQAMIVAQFLSLFAAGTLLKRAWRTTTYDG